MEREATFDLYRLALALIPDEDVAGDIFMRAHGEADLIRRANRWRQRHGLEPASPPPCLAELDPFQQAHALHLARRGRIRRRTGLLLSILLPALLLTLTGGLAALGGKPLPAVFQRQPVRSATFANGRKAAVYQVRAEPGAVTVYWSVTGAGSAEEQEAPTLELGVLQVKPAETEWLSTGGSRLAARSTYKVYVTTASAVNLRFGPDWLVANCPLEGELPEETLILAGRSATDGPWPVSLESVVLSRTATRVRYRAITPPGGQAARPTFVGISHGRLFTFAPARPVGDSGTVEVEFGPIPYGETELVITFQPSVEPVGPVVYALPDSAILTDPIRRGDRFHVTYQPEPGLVPLLGTDSSPFFTDQEGRRWETQQFETLSRTGAVQFVLMVESLPESAEFVSLTVPKAVRVTEVPPVRVDLTDR